MQTLDSYVAAAQLSDRRAAAATARAARRARKIPAASTDERLVLRRAAAEDELSLARLARLDSAPRPSGPMLVAEIDGKLVAAVPFGGGRAIADPFRCHGRPRRPPPGTGRADLPPARPRPPAPAPLPARAGRVAGAGARPRRAPGGYSGCGDTDDEQPADRARDGAGRARGRAARRRRRAARRSRSWRASRASASRRLVAELAARAAGARGRDRRVRRARRARSSPYAPIVSVLRTLARDDDPVLDELPDSARAELADAAAGARRRDPQRRREARTASRGCSRRC